MRMHVWNFRYLKTVMNRVSIRSGAPSAQELWSPLTLGTAWGHRPGPASYRAVSQWDSRISFNFPSRFTAYLLMPSCERFALWAIPSEHTGIGRNYDLICEAAELRQASKHTCKFKNVKAKSLRNLTCQGLQNSKYLSVIILKTFIISSLIW